MTGSAEFRALAARPVTELEACMRRGQAPDVQQLVSHEFRGANTAAWAERLRMRQFVKGFERRLDGRLFGYNRRVAQDGTWASPGKRFAFFEVRTVDAAARDNHYLQALLLDYGAGVGPLLDPARRIRDYLVRADPDSDALLLGRAFVAIGPFRLSPTYFVLEPVPQDEGS